MTHRNNPLSILPRRQKSRPCSTLRYAAGAQARMAGQLLNVAERTAGLGARLAHLVRKVGRCGCRAFEAKLDIEPNQIAKACRLVPTPRSLKITRSSEPRSGLKPCNAPSASRRSPHNCTSRPPRLPLLAFVLKGKQVRDLTPCVRD